MSSTVVPDSFEIRGRVFSGLDRLAPDQAERLYMRAVRYGNACGCGIAAVGASLGVPLYLLGLPVAPAIGAAVVAAVVGKCVGLWIAHRRFTAAGRRLEAALDGLAQR